MNFWKRFLASLKLNRWPLINYREQAKQEQQDRINRLYPKEKP